MPKYFLLFFLSVCLFITKINAQTIQTQLKELDSLGSYYWQKSSYTLALSYSTKALSLAEDVGDRQQQAKILNRLGIIYENKGDFEASFKYHFKALHLKEQLNDKDELTRSYLNIGITYASSGQNEKSIEYYQKALQINNSQPKPALKRNAHLFYHLSTTYRRLKAYQKAQEYAQKAFDLAIAIDEKVIIIDAQNGLGLIATEQKEYAKGRTYYQKVYELASQAQDWLILTNNLQHFAENYEQEHNYPLAINYVQQSLVLAQQHELKVEEQLAYLLLASLYQKQGNFETAYQYQTKGFALKDSLFNLQKSQQIAELTIEYETEKKIQQIKLLEKDQLLNHYLLSALGLGLGMVVAVAFYRYTIQKKLHQEKLAFQAMETQLEQERFREHIAHQERELASNSLYLLQKNEMLNTLQEKLSELSPNIKIEIKPLFRDIREAINLDKDWENFQKHFVEVHPDFFVKLSTNFPSISQNELKLLAYIRMKMSNKEVAALLNSTPKSVEMSRYRLKKKIGLRAEDNLDKWVESY